MTSNIAVKDAAALSEELVRMLKESSASDDVDASLMALARAAGILLGMSNRNYDDDQFRLRIDKFCEDFQRRAEQYRVQPKSNDIRATASADQVVSMYAWARKNR